MILVYVLNCTLQSQIAPEKRSRRGPFPIYNEQLGNCSQENSHLLKPYKSLSFISALLNADKNRTCKMRKDTDVS